MSLLTRAVSALTGALMSSMSIQGRFFRHPGEHSENVFEKIRGDMCDPAGCLSELFIQLSIIMIGKQFFNNFMELFMPYVQIAAINYHFTIPEGNALIKCPTGNSAIGLEGSGTKRPWSLVPTHLHSSLVGSTTTI